MKAAKANERVSWRDRSEADAASAPALARTTLAAVNARLAAGPKTVTPISKNIGAATAHSDRLTVRAENVLKELTAKLAGENPPKGRWTPSDRVLRKLTFSDLATARNCGPQTVDEIVEWAGKRGVIIRKPSYAGKSLATMWRSLIAKFPSGEFTRAEITEALERSMRRKNTKIPVAFQSILLQILDSGG